MSLVIMTLTALVIRPVIVLEGVSVGQMRIMETVYATNQFLVGVRL